jgi:hypothetical protein
VRTHGARAHLGNGSQNEMRRVRSQRVGSGTGRISVRHTHSWEHPQLPRRARTGRWSVDARLRFSFSRRGLGWLAAPAAPGLPFPAGDSVHDHSRPNSVNDPASIQPTRWKTVRIASLAGSVGWQMLILADAEPQARHRSPLPAQLPTAVYGYLARSRLQPCPPSSVPHATANGPLKAAGRAAALRTVLPCRDALANMVAL